MNTLYIISTPIGNMQDISFRAVRVLSEVDILVCEDTRRAGMLLDTLQIQSRPQLISYYDQIELRRIPEIISYLQEGKKIALVSDAGTPAISDPGFKLIRECIRLHIKVEAIPGPSSVITALTLSGLPTDKFTFLGYPPHKSGHRMKFFEKIKASQQIFSATIILFEAPHKLIRTLEEMQSVFGDVPIVLCREMTKIHEEVRREKTSESLIHFKKHNPKGEFVLLINFMDTA